MSGAELTGPRLLLFDRLHRSARARSYAADKSQRTGLLGDLALAVLFTLTAFVGAALLFMVQPMITKIILPLFGGSPAVWNASNLFFQISLLAGYVGAHVSVKRLGVRRQAVVHVGLVALPLLTLPVGLPQAAGVPNEVPPVLWLLYVLTLCVGAPFLLLSTTGPLLQRWFGATLHARARDPYFLFAAGNAGSLLALLSYPTVVEPWLSLDRQLQLWSYGYISFALLMVACSVALRRQVAVAAQRPLSQRGGVAPISGRRRLLWVAISALPSSFMLGTTTYLTTDLTPVPLLWVVPLALYLVSFIVPFALRRSTAGALANRASILIPVLLLTVATTTGAVKLPILMQVALHLALFATVATVAHARLAENRPDVEHLTGFYVLVALGGAVGGAVNGLLAPLVFNQFYEYPLALAAAALLLAGRAAGLHPLQGRWGRAGSLLIGALVLSMPLVVKILVALEPAALGVLALAVPALAWAGARRPRVLAAGIAAVTILPLVMTDTLVTSRTFFGVQQVVSTDDGRHVLTHGSTVHGWQDVRPLGRREPQGYYHRQGPAGQILGSLDQRPARIGVVGLGTAAIAAYGRAGDRVTFFEIDPKMVEIARDPQLFTYLSDTEALVDVVIGDGRLTLGQERNRTFDVIVLDAFSSDAVPVHLLTREAVGLYLNKLRPGGLLLFHVSNRHVDLAPVLADVARKEGAGAVLQQYRVPSGSRTESSDWVVVSTDPVVIAELRKTGRWGLLEGRNTDSVWRDDFSNILAALR